MLKICYYVIIMSTITIPKSFTAQDDLVVLPKREYEQLLVFKRVFPTYKPTASELRELKRAREDYKKGHYIEWSQLKNELASSRKGKSKKISQKVA